MDTVACIFTGVGLKGNIIIGYYPQNSSVKSVIFSVTSSHIFSHEFSYNQAGSLMHSPKTIVILSEQTEKQTAIFWSAIASKNSLGTEGDDKVIRFEDE